MDTALRLLDGRESEMILAMVFSMGVLFGFLLSHLLQVSWGQCDDQWKGASYPQCSGNECQYFARTQGHLPAVCCSRPVDGLKDLARKIKWLANIGQRVPLLRGEVHIAAMPTGGRNRKQNT